jgi:hypothetical protein
MECCLTDDTVPRSGLKRERAYEEDGAFARPAKLRRLGAKLAPFDSGLLPPEIVEGIAANLDTDDWRATLENHTNFSLANKFIRNVVVGAPRTESVDGPGKVEIDGGSAMLRHFRGKIHDIVSLATKTFRDIVPNGGLPDEASGDLPRDQRRNEPIVAHDITDAAGPLLPYIEAEDDKTKLLESIKALDDDEAFSESINSIARSSHGLDEDQILDIGWDAIDLFVRDGRIHDHDRVKAAQTLVRLEMRNHLSSDQREDINRAMTGSSHLRGLLDSQRQELMAEANTELPAASNAPNEPAAGHNINQAEMTLHERIDYLETQRHNAATAMVYTDHGRLDVQQSIAKEIPELYNQARAELAASVRNDRGR